MGTKYGNVFSMLELGLLYQDTCRPYTNIILAKKYYIKAVKVWSKENKSYNSKDIINIYDNVNMSDYPFDDVDLRIYAHDLYKRAFRYYYHNNKAYRSYKYIYKYL